MSKPAWKPTSECMEAIENMGCFFLTLSTDLDVGDNEDAECWKIDIDGVQIISKILYYYEDQAANAAYRFAWKYLRKKRPVKRAKQEGGR